MKHQKSNIKRQKHPRFQTSNPQPYACFGIGCLELLWSLEFGVWCFVWCLVFDVWCFTQP